MLSALGYDPATVQKRLGDAFYEQRLVREQVAQLTGRRFLGDYASDQAQYQGLMNAGIAFAKTYPLRPGIALSAQQMAQLTSDMVWLVEQTVTLPDGSTAQALVPQLYARVQPGDLDGTGALLAGRSVAIQLTGDLTNTATLAATGASPSEGISERTLAGRNRLTVSALNVQNLGGRITGQSVTLQANQDLANIGWQIDALDALRATAGRDLCQQRM